MRPIGYLILLIALGIAVVTEELSPGRFAEIEQYIARRRSETEVWYESQALELTLRAEGRFREFEQAELERLANQELVRRTYLRDNHFDIPPGSVLSEKQIKAVEERIAQRYEAITAELQRAIERLDERREYVLNTYLPELEARLRLGAVTPEPVTPTGMVTGIVYSADRALVLVGDKIVAAGEDVEGVEILAIGPHAVLFRKGDSQWEQSVRENPVELWNQSGR